jgi:ribosomal protein S18 acetylase RimI-like enzyme
MSSAAAAPVTEGAAYSIRKAREDDLDTVLALWHDLNRFQLPWRVFPPREGLEAEVTAWYRRGLTDPESILLVAEASGAVVGTAFGHLVVPSSLSDERAIELSGAVVRPSHRRLGIGEALAREIGRFAAGLGVRSVVVKTFARNEAALAFWERMGFEPRMVQMVAGARRLGDQEQA